MWRRFEFVLHLLASKALTVLEQRLNDAVERLEKEYALKMKMTEKEFHFFKKQNSALEEAREQWEKEKDIQIGALFSSVLLIGSLPYCRGVEGRLRSPASR